jgi:hypothetical protein
VIFGREPAAISSFIAAVIALAITFGLHLTVEQVGGIMTVVVLGLGLVVRQVSTPVNAPRLPIGTVVTAPDGGTPGVVRSTLEPS